MDDPGNGEDQGSLRDTGRSRQQQGSSGKVTIPSYIQEYSNREVQHRAVAGN